MTEISTIKPYLVSMKEYWNLKSQMQTKIMSTIPTDKYDQTFLKNYMKKMLEKTGNADRLKLLIQNSIYNFHTDSSTVDPEIRERFHEICLKWKKYLSSLNDKYFNEAAIEVKKLKKTQKDKLEPSQLYIFKPKDIIDFFSKYKLKEDDKLVRFQMIYFQIPNLKTIKAMFKELNVDNFDHIGLEDEEFEIEKEKACEDVIVDDSSNFEFLNGFKFGIPTSIRYKFLKSYIDLKTHPPPMLDKGASSELSESEIEIFSYFFKQDGLEVGNETSFFAFDDTIFDLASNLIFENEVLFDKAESHEDDFYNVRMAGRVVPIRRFSNYLGLFTFMNKKKDNVLNIIKFFLKNHVSKLYDFRASTSENLVGLSMIFERIFLRSMNQLYIHLRSIDVYPVDIAIKWMAYLFIGHFSVQQGYLLIDRLIGYNSLHLLPVVALSLFKSYEKTLMEAKNKIEVKEVFDRLKDVNFLEIVNNFLFG